MELISQMALKLLAQAGAKAGMATNEALCREPDRLLVRRLVRDARELLDDFLDAYEEASPATEDAPER